MSSFRHQCWSEFIARVNMFFDAMAWYLCIYDTRFIYYILHPIHTYSSLV